MNKIVLVIGTIVLHSIFFSTALAQSSVTYTVDIFATVPGCGDSIIQSGEQCDGTNFGGSSCNSIGFASGALTCSSVCTFVTAACVLGSPIQTGGSRTNNDSDILLPKTNFVISGYATPFSTVTLLKDSQAVGTAVAASDGTFQITISGLSPGSYLMQLTSFMQNRGFVFSDSMVVRISDGSTTKVSQVVLPPFVMITNNAGEITLKGIGIPNATISVFLDGVVTITATIDAEGNFSLRLDDVFTTNQVVNLRQNIFGFESNLSQSFSLPTGESEGEAVNPLCNGLIDLTDDCRVNFIDFAVALWNLVFNPGTELFDYNKDGRLDMKDFSIMAFYWTG